MTDSSTTKKEKKLSPQQEDFIEALFGEAKGDYKEALRIAGYSANTRVNDILKSLREEIIESAKSVFALNAPRAAFEMVDVMINPDRSGASNKMKAAQMVLDRVGISPKSSDSVELNIPRGGILILPAKDQS